MSRVLTFEAPHIDSRQKTAAVFIRCKLKIYVYRFALNQHPCVVQTVQYLRSVPEASEGSTSRQAVAIYNMRIYTTPSTRTVSCAREIDLDTADLVASSLVYAGGHSRQAGRQAPLLVLGKR